MAGTRLAGRTLNAAANRPITLAIDVGGSHVKVGRLDARGELLGGKISVATPKPCTPRRLVSIAASLARRAGSFDRVSVGLPGVVRLGRVVNAPNLSDRGWAGFDLGKALRAALKKPVRVMNDADMQGCAVIEGQGVELVLTLGTGVGTSLFEDGRLCPHLELGMAYYPAPKGKSYNLYIGDVVRERIGKARWNRRLRRVLAVLRDVTHYDKVYIGGGNARYVTFALGDEMRLVSNKAGLVGGIAAWRHFHDA